MNQRNVKFSLSSSLPLHISLPESISEKLANFSPQSVPPGVVTSDVVFDQDQLTCCFSRTIKSLQCWHHWQCSNLLFPNPTEYASVGSFVFLHNFDLQLRYGHYVITMPICCGTIIYTAIQLIIKSNYLSCKLKHLNSFFLKLLFRLMVK